MDLSVLIVDDEPVIRDYIATRIHKESPQFNISVVDSGIECLEYLKTNRVDCILSDYQMPGMNGMDLLKILRSKGDTTPLIFITAQGNEDLAREAFKNGAYDYFTKESGFAQFARIANSMEQAVMRHRTEKLKVKAEEALLEERDKLDAILASIGDAISIQDTEFRVLYQNPLHKELFGGHVGEFCYNVYARSDRVCEGCSASLAFKDGGVHTQQKCRDDGSGMAYYEVKASPLRDSTGRIVAAIESVRDITESKRAEEAVAAAELRYHTLFDQSPDGVLIVDGEGKFIEFNNAAHSQLGYTREEFANLCISDIDPVESTEEIRGKINEILEKGKAELEVKHRTKDGEVRDVHIINQAMVLSGQAVVHSIWRDITYRKELERQRSDFYAMVTHDIKSPLMTILGYADFLTDITERLDAQTLSIIGSIRGSCLRLVDLFDDFMSVSRMESGGLNLSPFLYDTGSILKGVIEGQEIAARGKNLTLKIEVAEDMPGSVMIDKKLVHRAVTNLVQNAVNYTPPGGAVTLKAECIKLDSNEFIAIHVSDNGPGIPVEEHAKVFEKYFRSSNALDFKGVGLGLFIVKSVAEAHGGKVELESEIGKGSTFKLLLPVAAILAQ